VTSSSGTRLPAVPTWWRRPGFDAPDGSLTLNGADLEALVREHGTPLFVYDLARPVENMRSLQAALDRAGVPFVTRFALKANPDPRILAVLRAMGTPGTPGSVGIDACSPGEVTHALANGWEPEEISHTGTNVSERDLDVLLAHDIRINLDGVSQVERLGRRAPGCRLHGAPRLRRRAPDQVRRDRGPPGRRDRRGPAACPGR
jgi:diaminopimelate decarboxylase